MIDAKSRFVVILRQDLKLLLFSSFLHDGHFYITPASELLFVWKSHYDRFIGFLALILGKQVLAACLSQSFQKTMNS